MRLASASAARRGSQRPAAARAVLLLVAGTACAAGFAAGFDHTASRAFLDTDPNLFWLLRAMALLKVAFAAAATAAVLWRLGSPVSLGWLAAYAVATAAMWSGPGLIWGMAHIGGGALLLHGGLLACLVLTWRDPVVDTRLAAIIAARRAAIRARSPGQDQPSSARPRPAPACAERAP